MAVSHVGQERVEYDGPSYEMVLVAAARSPGSRGLFKSVGEVLG